MRPRLGYLLFAWFCTLPLHAAECRNDLNSYNGYRVRQIRLWTPIGFISAATFNFNAMKARLPFQEGQLFSLHDLSTGNAFIKDQISSAGQDAAEKAKFVVVLGDLEDCDDSARTVGVVYRIFTNIYRPTFGRTFEERSQELKRPSTTSGEGGTSGRLLVRPLFGYDATRRAYGGADFSSTIPFAAFKSIELHPSFSSNSINADGSLNGSWLPHHAAMDRSVLQLGFKYLDEPAGAAKVQEAKATAQFSAATRPFGQSQSVVRYGLSAEGGHQQNETGQVVVAGVSPNSGYGAVKLYVGTTARFHQQTYTASYGLQVGSTLAGSGVDFVKHIADLGYSVRFLAVPHGDGYVPPTGKVHKPLDVELRATAGSIQQRGNIPAAERFYGGNQVEPFVSTDTWVVPGGAYIRSIPQNRLGGLALTGGLGGTHFFSGNVTVAKVLWGRPLVPDELASDPNFIPVLNGAVATAKGELVDYYTAHDPAAAAAYKKATAELDGIVATMQQITAGITALPASATSDPAIASSLSSIRSKNRSISRIIAAIKKGGNNNQFNALTNVQMSPLEKEITNLAPLLDAKGLSQAANGFTAQKDSLDKSRLQIRSSLDSISSDAAQKQANQDFSAADKVLRAFLYQLNIYSVAPVALFDVARVWPINTPTRYGAGGGVRLSLINVSLTLAYAANPVRSAGEGAGAFFVKLDVEDIFH